MARRAREAGKAQGSWRSYSLGTLWSLRPAKRGLVRLRPKSPETPGAKGLKGYGACDAQRPQRPKGPQACRPTRAISPVLHGALSVSPMFSYLQGTRQPRRGYHVPWIGFGYLYLPLAHKCRWAQAAFEMAEFSLCLVRPTHCTSPYWHVGWAMALHTHSRTGRSAICRANQPIVRVAALHGLHPVHW